MDIAVDLWTELKRYISVPDRDEAADLIINVLIDNDYTAEEIRAAFKGDTDIKHALEIYLDDAAGDDDEDLEDYDDDNDNYR